MRLDAIMSGRSLPWAPVPALSGPGLVLAWARASLTRLAAHRPELDGINVFPVADRDTGTNMLLTMRAAAAACGRDDALVTAAETLARGALLGARGNSGVILSQVLRGVAEAVAACLSPEERAQLIAAGALLQRLAEYQEGGSRPTVLVPPPLAGGG